MHIAYTIAPGKGDMDLLLYGLSQRLATRGVKTCGAVQVNTDCGEGPCDMDLTLLPDGPEIRISESRGPGARGCRLDADGLERAVAQVGTRLQAGADVLIVNKFGKQEAGGGGFRDIIGDALASGIPGLVGLNGLNKAAFEAFTDGLAVEVHPDPDALEDWVTGALAAPV